jgi:hypothetical protein
VLLCSFFSRAVALWRGGPVALWRCAVALLRCAAQLISWTQARYVNEYPA